MRLVVDNFPVVAVLAPVGEARLDGRVDELLERPLPENPRRGARGERLDIGIVLAPHLAIDREI